MRCVTHMKHIDPTVSVIMGVRNGGKGLASAIDSILVQTIQSLEFIICDDGSTDNTRQQIARYAADDGRILMICHDMNQGLAPTLNHCLHMARGRYIARMDADDLSHPQRLERQITYLENHPQIAFVGCLALLRRNGAIVGKRSFPEYPIVRDFYINQPFLHPTLVFRREALEAVAGYSENKHCILCEDYDLLLRLYTEGYLGANIQETLFTYTLPITAKGNRKIRHRWNEVVTRWQRFQELGLLPWVLPWVIKPLVVGLLPEGILSAVKDIYIQEVDAGG